MKYTALLSQPSSGISAAVLCSWIREEQVQLQAYVNNTVLSALFPRPHTQKLGIVFLAAAISTLYIRLVLSLACSVVMPILSCPSLTFHG